MSPGGPDSPRRGGDAPGFGLLALLLVWAAFVHHGVGPEMGADAWYAPRGFLRESSLGIALVEPPGLAFATLGLPALLLCLAVLATTRRALAAALALACLAATLLFVFYGVVAPFPWRFFGPSGSAVLVLTALVLGFALAAPRLAEDWLSLSWPLRIACYLPFVAFVVAFLRNATGTDPTRPLAISPWPAVPVFGIEVGALFVAALWIGTAAGLAGIARSGGSWARRLGAVLLGAGLPVLLLSAGAALHLLPFGVGTRLQLGGFAVCAAAIAAAAAIPAADGREARARRLGVGALLIAFPLVAGQAWAALDYHRTREVRARALIDALAAYQHRETLYPDTLEALVAAGLLERIPEPAIGFDLLYDGRFEYQSFGSSYLLEFPAPRWVQCAYTPAATFAEYEDEEDGDDEALEESWSCPSRPPELW